MVVAVGIEETGCVAVTVAVGVGVFVPVGRGVVVARAAWATTVCAAAV